MTSSYNININSNTSKVKKICFNPINPEEIKKYAVCEIKHADLYTKDKEARYDGINDPRLGPINNLIKCDTCHETIKKCPGHFGYLKLASPVYNPIFLKKILLILNNICIYCSNLLIDKSNINFIHTLKKTKKIKRLNLLNKNKPFCTISTTISKCFQCYYCQKNINYKFIKDGFLILRLNLIQKQTANNILIMFEKTTKIYADTVLPILKKISQEDRELIGILHPEWLIIEIYPIVPPIVRPTINYGCNQRCEDDLVYKLINLIKFNKKLKEKTVNHKYIDYYKEHVQWSLSILIDNNIKGIPQSLHRSNNRILKSFKDRIKGKEGRLRGNILGKRVNFSARTVIGPDPYIKINEIGIPFKICKILTFPEIVNQFNIQQLTQCVKNGSEIYPGANYVIQNTFVTKLENSQIAQSINLQYGDIVHRHLNNNDYILFNRQPSLHKMSMMGHKVFPIKGKSFRLKPSVTKPYNADFDGDEMNVIVPQNQLSMMEIKDLTCVQKQIISPQSNSPIIGSIMDNILGSYILTLPNEFISEKYVQNLLLKCSNFNGILPPCDLTKNNEKFWKGSTIFSFIFPNNFTVHNEKKKNDKFLLNYKSETQNGKILIVDGQIKNGILDSKIISSCEHSLIHFINNYCDGNTAAKFIDNIEYLTNQFLKFRGFSVGYYDFKRDNQLQKNNIQTILSAKKQVIQYITNIYTKTQKILKQDFEKNIFNTLNKARDDIGNNVMQSIDKNNSFYQMIKSGAKGNILNISQILGSVGQQNIQWNKKQGRVPLIVNNRTLPFYYQFDSSPEARGFVEHSYVDGLNVNEFFFHMQAGREGVIDTACKTADVGYLQRKLIKSLEDIKICYDMTVRNEGNRVVQFVYNCNNSNTITQEHQKFLIFENKKDFKKKYEWNIADYQKTFRQKKISEQNAKLINNEYLEIKKLIKYFRKKKIFLENELCLSLNISKIIKLHTNKLKKCVSTFWRNPLTIKEIIDTNHKLLQFIKLNQNTKFPFSELNDYNMKITRLLIICHLSTKQLLYRFRINKLIYHQIINTIKQKFYKYLIDPGTAVGPLAAQSIGEPCTQLSVVYDTKVKIKINNLYSEPKIGVLIDKYLTQHKNQVITTNIVGSKSYILPISPLLNIQTLGININTGKAEYKPITAFSKHPPNGKLVKITLKSGRQVCATAGHSFVIKKQNKIIIIRGDQLKIGDLIPVCNHR